MIYEPSIVPFKIILIGLLSFHLRLFLLAMYRSTYITILQTFHLSLMFTFTWKAFFLLTSVWFPSQVKHEESDMFPQNGTSAVIREGNILKMQRKQKPCAPLPSNKNSRYYRPRVNVSNKNLTFWGNDGSLLAKPTNSHIFDSFWRFSCFGLAGKVCQQGISSPATASSREGELEKMNPASRGISGVSLTP